MEEEIQTIQTQSSKKWIILSIIILMLIGATITATFLLRPQEPVEYGKRALEQNNVSICLETPLNLGSSNSCYRYVAKEKQDFHFCDMLENPTQIGECYSSFILVRWCNDGKIICEEFATEKEKIDCYMLAAIYKNDKTLCEKTTSNEDKELCIFQVEDQNRQQEPCTWADLVAP